MSHIDLNEGAKAQVIVKIKQYFEQELSMDIGAFDAEFLLDFFAQELGAYFYNQGLLDAQVIVAGKVEEIADAISEIEKPIN